MDDRLGWVHNVHFAGASFTSLCAEDVVLQPYPHRLITRFPLQQNRQRLLFLGDSYTKANNVSSGQAYYDVFEEETDGRFSVYAVGHSGYGSVQEFMALEEVYEDVEPDIVVWQLTGNDVRDNVYEFDDNSFLYSQQKPRPYYDLTKGVIRMRNPGPILFDHSILFRTFFRAVYALDARHRWGLLRRIDRLNELTEAEKAQYSDEGLGVLAAVVEKVVTQFPHSLLVGFSVDSEFDAAFGNVFREHGALYLDRFYERIDQVEGTSCLPMDFHWNHLGHEVAGRELAALLPSVIPSVSSSVAETRQVRGGDAD